jgi:large subunit ribosomal protein L18
MSEYLSKKTRSKRNRRQRAHRRVRQRIQGTPERPRLAVYRSLRFIYAQVIDDLGGRTLAQASSAEKELQAGLKGSPGSCAAARKVGEAIAERAKAQGVQQVVFDRGGPIYHGKVKSVADGARDKGLSF